MFPTNTDASAVKLAVDHQGVVWSLEGEGMPFCSHQYAGGFVRSWKPPTLERVRVVGGPENVQLILRLYEFLRHRPGPVLEVCSPLCSEGADRRDPELTLYRMRGYGLPPSLGGWHAFGALDLPSYALAHLLNPACGAREGQANLDTVLRWLYIHPVWPALSFVDHLNRLAAAQLLALIIDPRWFIDLAHPDRQDRLEQFLGLNAKTQGGLDRGNASWRSDRCRLVFKSWNTLQLRELPQAPGRFLYRARGTPGGSRGDLQASKVFVDFLRQVWLNVLCTGPQAGRLFVPEYFFALVDEVEAFREHIVTQGRRR